ncbi:MAG: helix-turn-helix domain-containing protein [Bacteroidetes bacterium]|nr:helix-turn-helix domain-containing protein [Bacteroidota bacterium]MBU2584638.1 helix-turn-helix domain-containing protein [Bacteroidota bacterium]
MKTKITYNQLIHKFSLKKIKNLKDYNRALTWYESLIDNYDESNELNEYLDVLALLIEEYEEKKFPIPEADPVDIIKYLMEEKNIKQVELAKAFGSQSIVSEVLNRKRGLTLKYIYNIADILKVKPQVFV